ncbi:MAG TPA: Gx transporter family protein [Candidatus Cloacimonadota bacterium]|nr:Gx transporter family protein [Candidatus Cloacimonadota bacterium]HQH49967.1 Gx transporter family protein [Candidatus Cloacimonadota bacterium]
MSQPFNKALLVLAFLTATACSVQIAENLIMRLLPLPFIRIGLSNVVILYLVQRKQVLNAVIVNVTKSLVGGIATFTLLSPGTLLSLGGGFVAVLVMWAADRLPLGFSVFGVSVLGAVAHNLAQLSIVKSIVLPQADVFVLTPILLVLALISGFVTAWILLAVQAKYQLQRFENGN